MPYELGPKPRLGYANSPIERAADRRLKGDEIAALAASPRAGFYLIGGEMIVAKAGNPSMPLFTRAEAQAFGAATETVFLGLIGEDGRFAYGLTPEAAETLKARSDLLVTDLRSIAIKGLVDAQHLPPIAQAKAMLHWHARHRHCSNCGAQTTLTDCGWKRTCPQCKAEHFPRTDPVVIMLSVDGDRCVLGRSPRFVPTMWSCLAGFIEPGESFEDAVRRETKEEAGIETRRVRYFASQPWPFPMSLMIGCHAEAVSSEITVDREELEDARWFSKDEVAAMLTRTHPQGLTCPPGVAIAHHIMRAWVEDEVSFG